MVLSHPKQNAMLLLVHDQISAKRSLMLKLCFGNTIGPFSDMA